MSSLRSFEKIKKNVTSRKFNAFEQSRVARFVVPESTLAALNYKLKNLNQFYEIVFQKSQETSYLENYKALNSQEARFATPKSTLTAPNYRVGNFKFKK